MLKREHFIIIYLFLLIIMTYVGLNYLMIASMLLLCVNAYINNKGKLHLGISKKSRFAFFIIIIYMIFVTLINFKVGNPCDVTDIWSRIINQYFTIFITLSFLIYKCDINKLLLTIRNLGWPLLILGIIEEFTRINPILSALKPEYLSNLTKQGRICTIFEHPIVYGFYLLFIFFTVRNFPYKKKVITIFYEILTVLNILFTRTRGVVVAILVLILLEFLKGIFNYIKNRGKIKVNKKQVNMSILGCIVIIGIMVFMYSTLATFLNEYFERLMNLRSLSDQGLRVAALVNYQSFLKDANSLRIVFGSGEGFQLQYLKLYPIYNWDATVDNMYLNFLLNYGIVGAVMLIGMCVHSIFVFFKQNINLGKKCANLEIIACSVSFITFDGLSWPFILGLYLFCIVIMLRKECNKELLDTSYHIC